MLFRGGCASGDGGRGVGIETRGGGHAPDDLRVTAAADALSSPRSAAAASLPERRDDLIEPLRIWRGVKSGIKSRI
jgi:hypothetical protein